LLAVSPLAAEQTWYLVLLGGKRTGTQTETVQRQPDSTVRTELHLRLALNRYGQSFTVAQRQVWVEAQTLLSVDSETEFNGDAASLFARVQGEDLIVQEKRSGSSSERLLPQTGPLLGPRGAEDRLREALAEGPLGSGPPRELSFREFSPETGGVHELRLRLLGAGELTDSQGGLHRGQRVDVHSSAAPGVSTEAVYDERGALEYSITRVGVALEVVRGLPGEARGPGGAGATVAPGPGGSTAALASDLERFEVASLTIPVRWPAALQGPGGVPRLGSLGALTVRFAGPALADLERSVREAQVDLLRPAHRRDGRGLVLTLEPQPPAPAWPQDAAAGPEWTGDGFYLDLGDARLEELLNDCRPSTFSCLETLVDRTIRTKSLQFGFAGVREVLDSRAGDCTEHALLLAALLRKRGIPARLAYGFLLTEAGFIGHAWTEARAGSQWFWLDPSFPEGRPYPYKLRLGVIDPAQPVWGQIGVSLLAVAGGVRAEILEAADGR
jgi:hypothetical protein